MPLDKVGRRDGFVLELPDGERGAMGCHFGPKRHLDTRTVLHGGVEYRFGNRDVLAGPLGKLRDKRVELFGIIIGKRGLHRFVTRVERKDGRIDPVARDILDILVMHDRIDKTIAKEVLVHVVMDLLPLDRRETDPEVLDDVITGIPELLFGLIRREVLCVDVERLKKPLF